MKDLPAVVWMSSPIEDIQVLSVNLIGMSLIGVWLRERVPTNKEQLRAMLLEDHSTFPVYSSDYD